MRILLGKVTLLCWIFSLVYSVAYAVPECSLDIRGADGAPLSIVGTGIPFQVIVTMRNCTDQPIVNLDDAAFAVLRRVSIQTRIINNNSSVSYIYTARIDSEGSYIIGPASVQVSGIVYETNSCPIEVGAQEKTVGARFIMKIFCDDDVVYIGQETLFRVRVYSATSVPEVESLHIPPVEGIIVGDLRESHTGVEYIDKIKYRYKEFSAPLSVQTTGKFLIPAHSADIRDDQARRGGFGFFFSTIAPTKQIYSNSLSIEAQTLPVADKATTLIGNYTSVSASVDPTMVTLGQAIRYKLTLAGTGNALKIKAPLLSEVPSECKYYDSSVIGIAQNDTVVFEYIIQPRAAGTWEIPAQEIVYFDPKKEEYLTLYSEPVVITVLPVQDSPKDIPTLPQNTDSKNPLNSLQEFHPDLCSSDPIPTNIMRIPWFWYWVIFIMSVCFFFLFGILNTFIVHYNKNNVIYRHHFAFYNARKSINIAEKKQKKNDLYKIFITLFADWLMIEKSRINEKFIKEKLATLGVLSEDGLESWNRFWYKIVYAQYGISPVHDIDKTIYTEARLWVVAFSKVGIQ